MGQARKERPRDGAADGQPASVVHRPTGWNTWDFRGFNRLVYLERGRTVVAVQYAIWDDRVPPPAPDSKKIGQLFDTFRWSDVTRLGPHAPLGLPAVLEFKASGVPYAAEASARGGALKLTVRPLARTRQRVVFLFTTPVGEAVERASDAAGRLAGCTVSLTGATWPRDYFINVAEPCAIAAPGRPTTLRLAPPRNRRSRRAGEPALSGTGALEHAPEAMLQAVTWNTLYDTRRRLVSSPVSRDWCYDWRGVLVFCWDTYLVGTFVSYASPELARLNFETVTAGVDALGFVPNYFMAHGATSRDRSMPPLGAYTIWKTQCAGPDRAWLRTVYPQLCRWHAFWMRRRAGGGTGLLAWGSDPVAYEFPELVPYNGQLQHCRQAAVYESGLDNSPMYDDVAFDPQTNTLELDDVGLSSLYALDCEALANMAEFLGETRDAARFRREHATIARHVNDLLWDEQHGIYCNRHRGPSARHSEHWSPTSFFPLIAGLAPPDRARRLVDDHLLNEREFWGRWVIPSIARSDPAYRDNDYWRGRIWGPLNFLVAEGLRRYRFDNAAAELARKSLDLFMKNWRADGGVYENYNAETGAGGDVWNAARLYHWGGLLAFIAMQELIDVEPAGYLRLGSLHAPDAGLHNVHIGRDTYDIKLDAGVHVRRNGRPFLDCTTRAIMRLPLGGPKDEPIELSTRTAGRLTLHAPDRPLRTARPTDGTAIQPRKTARGVTYTW